MSLSQADDFLAESEALFTVLRPLGPADFGRATAFKGWTIDDVLVHLHVWNEMVDLSLTDPARFDEVVAQIAPSLHDGGFRAVENPRVGPRGPRCLIFGSLGCAR